MNVTEFEWFLQEHEKDIFSFCRYLTMDAEKADELYQDTVLKAFESRASIDASQNVKSFFFSIAVGKWKNARRKAGRRNEIAPTVFYEDLSKEPISGENLERQVQNKFLWNCIETTLAKMEDKFRIPMILRYFDDCGDESIAKICKIPKGTVKSRLHKGRALLSEALRKEGFDYE